MAISLLLLESDESARTAYASALREAECLVSIAADSAAAYAAAMANVPDVIVIGFDDVVRDDRFGLSKRLGADPRTRRVPILMTSPVATQSDLERATTTGVLVLVLESRDAAKLVSAVRGVVAARLKPSPLRVSIDSPPKDEISHKDKPA
jgi:CheY-like chemotaxis protein